jgi:exopolyphosphatase/guanosine-5'-triphosphate,3'-diphosphate pyrophosphatase
VGGGDTRPSGLVALLDLGSNAARFLLVKVHPGRGFAILAEHRVQTRLAGDRRGHLPGPAVRKTLHAAHVFLETARRRGVARVIALATAAVRDADNPEVLLEPLRRHHALDVRVLSGREEARLGACAALASLPLREGLVVDLGGGSLQLTRLRAGTPEVLESLPLGAVRATTQFLRHDPPTGAEVSALERHARELLASILPAAADAPALVGLGGTIRTLARMHRATGHGAREIHAARLARTAVTAIRQRLASMPLRRRRGVDGLKPERADIIVAGAVIVEALMELGGYEQLVVCAHGVRHGVLVEETFGPVVPA